MRLWLPFLFLVSIYSSGFAQITGRVQTVNGEPLSAVNIYLEGGFVGTTSNQNGDYELPIKKPGQYRLIFQYLGYKTFLREIEITEFPYVFNVELEAEQHSLDAVVIDSKENPANRIIRQAIAHRKANKYRIKKYTADFYSKGNWTVENMPKKILGQELDIEGQLGLDSTGTGIIYLSETKSLINFSAPDNFHEQIIASKVSGNDNGFSLNSAKDADFSFYENTIRLNADLISPIAGTAFSYYRYNLVSAHYAANGQLINKIEVLPRREGDRVFSGFIYIVEDTWEIYGIELRTTGVAAQIPPIKEMEFTQNFTYSPEDGFWVKRLQNIEFDFRLLGVTGTGQFLGVYSNYDFSPSVAAKIFGREIMGWDENANKKSADYWEENRPIPLVKTEVEDYFRKDSIAKIRDSKAYKDSIDRERNKWSFTDLIFGYSYQNSVQKWRFSVSSPLNGIHFNTVQGWNLNLNLGFTQTLKERERYWKLFSDVGYGFADKKLWWSGGFQMKFNNFSKPLLTIEGGRQAKEINTREPMDLRINDVAAIFFERNYLKLYDKKFLETRYSQELVNGLFMNAKLALEERTPLLNATEKVYRHDKNGGFTSNNPLRPDDFTSVPFQQHRIAKLGLRFKVDFKQSYYTYPDGKYNDLNRSFPSLFAGMNLGFSASHKSYEYQQVYALMTHRADLKAYGNLTYTLEAGKFFNAENIALVDYQHFWGNQTRVKAHNYMNVFNLMPYYDFSTNKEYIEAHFGHDFKGLVMGKIPYLNRLNFNLVVGGHVLWSAQKKPYQEVSIGLDNMGVGAFRFFRLDYVHSFYGDTHQGALIFGLKFLNLLN